VQQPFCPEAFSDSLVPNNTELRPNAIINITNDTWFGNTPGTYQHLDMVRRYAIESGLPVIRANYSGISAFVLSDGEIVASLPIGQSGILDGTIWGAHDTIYRAIGRDGWMIIILILSCIGAICMNAPQKKD
jgi:apolipoprotein N-acyltransferase